MKETMKILIFLCTWICFASARGKEFNPVSASSSVLQNWDTLTVWDSLDDFTMTICLRDMKLYDDFGFAILLQSSLFQVDSLKPDEGPWVMAMVYPGQSLVYNPTFPMIFADLERHDCFDGYCIVDVCLDFDVENFVENDYYDKVVVPSGTTVTETFSTQFALVAFTDGDVGEWEVSCPKLIRQAISKVYDFEDETEVNVCVFDNNDWFTFDDLPIKVCHVEFHASDAVSVSLTDPDNLVYMTGIFFDFVDDEIKTYIEPTLAGLDIFERESHLEGSCQLHLEIENVDLGPASIVFDLPFEYSRVYMEDFQVPELIVPEVVMQICDDFGSCVDTGRYFGEGGTFPNAVKLLSGLDVLTMGVTFGGEAYINATIHHKDGSVTEETLELTGLPEDEYDPTLVVTLKFDDSWWSEKHVKRAERIFLKGYIILGDARRSGVQTGSMILQTETFPSEDIIIEEEEDVATSGCSRMGRSLLWI